MHMQLVPHVRENGARDAAIEREWWRMFGDRRVLVPRSAVWGDDSN